MAVSATGMAMNTPKGPKSKCFANSHASGICINQKPNRLITVGVRVSPAPLNALLITIPMP